MSFPAPPPLRIPAAIASRLETAALMAAAVSGVIGGAAGLLLLRETRPLMGSGSIGDVAAVIAALASGAAFLVAALTLTPQMQPWLASVGRVRRVIDLAALALLYGVFALLLIIVVFTVFAQAFQGLSLDHWAGAFWVALSAAICTYIAVLSAASLTASSVSQVLTGFVVTGVMVSALSASDPDWWRHHFSALGATEDTSGLTFNTTLLLAGFALISMGDFVGHDLAVWARQAGEPRWKVRSMRLVLVVLGILLALVALIPVNADRLWHDAAAQSMVLVFGLALIGVPIMLRRLPGPLLPVTGIVLGLLVAILILWRGIHYFRITAFEISAASIVLGWLVLLTRIIGAAAADVRGPEAPMPEVAVPAVEPPDATTRSV